MSDPPILRSLTPTERNLGTNCSAEFGCSATERIRSDVINSGSSSTYGLWSPMPFLCFPLITTIDPSTGLPVRCLREGIGWTVALKPDSGAPHRASDTTRRLIRPAQDYHWN